MCATEDNEVTHAHINRVCDRQERRFERREQKSTICRFLQKLINPALTHTHNTHTHFYQQLYLHAESKISTQSVEQQTGYREGDVLPEGLDDKRLRDNREMDAGSQDQVSVEIYHQTFTVLLLYCLFCSLASIIILWSGLICHKYSGSKGHILGVNQVQSVGLGVQITVPLNTNTNRVLSERIFLHYSRVSTGS